MRIRSLGNKSFWLQSQRYYTLKVHDDLFVLEPQHEERSVGVRSIHTVALNLVSLYLLVNLKPKILQLTRPGV